MVAPKFATSRLPRSGDAPERGGLPRISEEVGNAREVIAIGSGQPAMGGRRVVRRIGNMALLSHIPYHRGSSAL